MINILCLLLAASLVFNIWAVSLLIRYIENLSDLRYENTELRINLLHRE